MVWAHELEVDLEEQDPAFVHWARIFIRNLKHIKDISPFRRNWVPEDHDLLGFIVYTDGGKIGLETAIYALSSKDDEAVEKALCIANGRLGKRNIVAHEVLAGLLGAEDLYRLLQPLLFDHRDSASYFYFKSDSLCGLVMINPQVTLKNTLLDNGINGFIEAIKKISLEFPESIIQVGYTETLRNPADYMTKLF